MDLRTTSGYFNCYAVNFKEFKFYCPSYGTRIVEAINVKFLVDLSFSESDFPRMIKFKKPKDSTELHKNKRQLVIVQENHLNNFKQ